MRILKNEIKLTDSEIVEKLNEFWFSSKVSKAQYYKIRRAFHTNKPFYTINDSWYEINSISRRYELGKLSGYEIELKGVSNNGK